MKNTNLISAIDAIAAEKGLSRKGVAKLIGKKPPTLSTAINRGDMRVSTLRDILRPMDAEIIKLVKGKEKKIPLTHVMVSELKTIVESEGGKLYVLSSTGNKYAI